jgi:hypothetical protein
MTAQLFKNKKLIFPALLLLILAANFWVFFVGKNSQVGGKAEMQKVRDQIGQLIFLPADEDPTLATVADEAKIKSSAFLAQARNGDKVLIYLKAKKAIIYRPSLNKIVDVGPLVIGKDSSPLITSRFAIFNGSSDPAQTAKMVSSVLSTFPNASIVDKESTRSFSNTIVIDLSGKNQPLAEQIADSLGIKAGQVPLGIATPAADLLIIIGQDKKGTS